MADTSLDDLQEEPPSRSERPSKDWSVQDRKVLGQAILRGGLVIAMGTLALALPEQDTDTMAALIGVTALVIALGTVIVELGWRSAHAGSTFTLFGQAAALAAIGALLIFWTLMCIVAPDLVYRTQSRWFPMPRNTFNITMYSFLGLFKVFFLFFNVVPYVALVIIG